MYAITNRCLYKRGSRTNYIYSSIPYWSFIPIYIYIHTQSRTANLHTLPLIPIKPQLADCTSSIVISKPAALPCFRLQDSKSKLLYCDLWSVWNKRTMTIVVKNQWWNIDRAHKNAYPKVQNHVHIYCIFMTCCIFSGLFLNKYNLFHNFIFSSQIILTFK
jgi:hypothetical protein